MIETAANSQWSKKSIFHCFGFGFLEVPSSGLETLPHAAAGDYQMRHNALFSETLRIQNTVPL
jgi:hypothetical protein